MHSKFYDLILQALLLILLTFLRINVFYFDSKKLLILTLPIKLFLKFYFILKPFFLQVSLLLVNS